MTDTPTQAHPEHGTTVVLGWDALDAQLVEEFGLADAFGAHGTAIDTFANDVIGEPHTREVWPSIITGVPPAEHGIYAATDDEGVKWSNPAIRLAARAAQYTVPEDVKTVLGRWLRSKGAGVEKYSAEYYSDQGLETVFDGRRSFPIAVPNYWTDRDEAHGFLFDRGAHLGKWLDRGPDGWRPADWERQVAVEREMYLEASTKLGLIHHAIQQEHDLVFAWFGFVDTFGHVEPAAAEPVQRRAYEQAARWTEGVRASLSTEDTLICLSDHGLRGGSHTMDAYLGADNPLIPDMVDSVFDVRAMLDRITPSRPPVDPPALRNRDTRARAGDAEAADAVRSRLEELGYV